MSNVTHSQARNQGSQGGFAPLENFPPPPEKMSRPKFKSIGHSAKNLSPSQKTLCPPWCPKLVTGLHIAKLMLKQSLVWYHWVWYFY